jgi:hypothetical protein
MNVFAGRWLDLQTPDSWVFYNSYGENDLFYVVSLCREIFRNITPTLNGVYYYSSPYTHTHTHTHMYVHAYSTYTHCAHIVHTTYIRTYMYNTVHILVYTYSNMHGFIRFKSGE